MIETLSTFFRGLIGSFRLADAIDIAVIAVFLYSALVWFRETASRQVVVGMTLLAFLYFAARSFDLYMTSQLLHSGFAVLLIILVVIFQEDLRRIFERIAVVGTFRQLSAPAPDAGELDLLVHEAFGLADDRVGALIVVKGHDDLERHVQGGVELNGRASKPLLDSIFDPHSAGHDGAVIIDGDRIDRFAVHLPISKNRKEIGSRGTRHAAALGLSERCDALLVVVSEERGVVSIAVDGELSVIPTPAELKGRLVEFVEEKFPVQRESALRRLVLHHWRIKFFSVFMACIGWCFFAYNPSTIQRTFVVPIEYRNVPKTLDVDEFAPTETRVTLSGSEPAFRILDPATLKIAIDLNGSIEGVRTISVARKNLSLPTNLTLYRIEHSTIFLTLHPRPNPDSTEAQAKPSEPTTDR